jgi:hypothetical protein
MKFTIIIIIIDMVATVQGAPKDGVEGVGNLWMLIYRFGLVPKVPLSILMSTEMVKQNTETAEETEAVMVEEMVELGAEPVEATEGMVELGAEPGVVMVEETEAVMVEEMVELGAEPVEALETGVVMVEETVAEPVEEPVEEMEGMAEALETEEETVEEMEGMEGMVAETEEETVALETGVVMVDVGMHE